VGRSEIEQTQSHLWSHADRPRLLQLLDGHGLYLSFHRSSGGATRSSISAIADRKKPRQALPIEDTEKAKLLPVKSPLLRLRLVVHWIEQLNSNWFVGLRAWRSMREIDPDVFTRWFTNGCIVS
jgi:hypothetical protein